MPGIRGAAVAYGLHARSTDVLIVARLRRVLSDMMSDKAFTDRLYAIGFEVRPLIGDAYRDFIAQDM